MNRILGFVFFVILNDDLLIKAMTVINEWSSPLAVITWDYQEATQRGKQIIK